MKKFTYIKFIYLLEIFCLLFFSASAAFANTDEGPSPPEITGQTGIVMDVLTGKVLYEKMPILF